ncbi:FRG domain-containing protein [Leptospira sp. 201903074]|uniref:FRG domain-containing protein n=1 Tax=Leptospira abararensis TaxID=2810036 RepID=UPI0019630DD4|nr:FRG domain-containing protein [Leptospira abararensis]MBM9548756.1 FRG domain-containing protein [Leptospira abararensis]
MRKIRPELTKELIKHFKNPFNVGKFEPYSIESFRELVEIISNLSYKNKDYFILFRGQTQDYQNKGKNSTFYPTIYRGDYLQRSELLYKFDLLHSASNLLKKHFKENKIEGFKEVLTKKYIQWSILQHYEVCDTPLLDFTQSLRVACSFALHDNNLDYGYVFAFGFPYLTNRISINSEHDLANIRLLSIAPPDALRPYFQEGYLAGTADVEEDYENKLELDFNNRLIAKFKIPNDKKFWNKGFNVIPKDALYPDEDKIQSLCIDIKNEAVVSINPENLGEFLIIWRKLEEIIMKISGKFENRSPSILSALRNPILLDYLEPKLLDEINSLRQFRNYLFHINQNPDRKTLDYNITLANKIYELLSRNLRKIK